MHPTKQESAPVRPQRAPTPPAENPEIRLFREDDWPAVAHYYESRYRSGYILSHRTYFDWWFGSPFRPDSRHGQRLVVDPTRAPEERVVGACGAVPWPLQVAGEQTAAQCLFNLLLDRQYRRGTLGYRLLSETTYDLPYTMAVGVRPIVLRLMPRVGPTLSFEMHRPVRVLDLDACRSLFEGSSVAERMGVAERTDALDALSAAAAAPCAPAPAGARLERAEGFGDEWDAAWGRIRPHYGTTTWRSAAFLNWRYTEYPYPIYEPHVLRDADGRAAGLVVLREEQPPFGSAVRVVDAVAEGGAMGPLLALVEEEARRRGAAFVDSVVGGRRDGAALAAAGYRELAVEGWESLLPADLNPVRWRKRRITSFLTRPGAADAEGHPPPEVEGDLYFVKGDSDLDRAF